MKNFGLAVVYRYLNYILTNIPKSNDANTYMQMMFHMGLMDMVNAICQAFLAFLQMFEAVGNVSPWLDAGLNDLYDKILQGERFGMQFNGRHLMDVCVINDEFHRAWAASAFVHQEK